MSSSSGEKCVGVGIKRINESGEATMEQLSENHWIVAVHSPLNIFKRCARVDVGEIAGDWEWEVNFVDDESHVDRQIVNGFEEVISQELVNRGVVDALNGISVFEVVFYGRNGVLHIIPRIYLVLKSSSPVALYSCSSLALAWGAALALSRGEAPMNVMRLDDPLRPRLNSTLGVKKR
ncbi:hypothetical protein NRY95_12630 [Xanthomonas campestris pv. phormiicola]|nr:hypothetical protein [Xanthomonas campestris pv. phormiicola]UYC14592.1 hypothetical protein NRY95_12630 [Xanthomonas campestris pv. phormiicola]